MDAHRRGRARPDARAGPADPDRGAPCASGSSRPPTVRPTSPGWPAGLSGALHTDRAVELVLEMLVGPVVDWAQVTLTDRRQLTFRARSLDGRVHHVRAAAADLDAGSSLGRALTTGLTDLLMVPDGDDTDSSALASAVPAEELRDSL